MTGFDFSTGSLGQAEGWDTKMSFGRAERYCLTICHVECQVSMMNLH